MAQAVAIDSGRRAGLTLVLCFLGVLCEGLDIQSMGLAAPRMAPVLGLTRDQLGPVFSASIVGLLIGAVICGRLADRFGRKRVLVACLLVFGVFSLATAAARSFDALLLVRLIAGLGLGGALPNLVALAAEAVTPEHRAGLVTRITCGLPFGGVIAGLVAANLDWQDIFYIGGAAPLLLAPFVCSRLPEFQAFLEARDAAPARAQPRDDFAAILFGDGRARATLLLWTASFASLLSLYVLLNWLPTLMGDLGLAKPAASLVSLLFNLGAASGVLILAELLDRAPAQTNDRVLVSGPRALDRRPGDGEDRLSQRRRRGLRGRLLRLSSVPLPLYGLAPGYYPVSIRGAGVGASVAVGRLGAICRTPAGRRPARRMGAGAPGVLLALLPIEAVAGAATMALIARPRLAD